ncbi:MAG TPA: phosphatidate cytidylyltransferase [Acidimicrobiia bacterium]|jgi:phosphatidate cytidylyltransferase|nr:phosphatidate cytidylyltransferase [Acidimicrobiia bacterium]
MEAMTAPLQWAMGGVFAALVTASATTSTLARLRPGLELSEVRLRVRSWWVMAAVFVVALASHRIVTIVFLASVAVAALWELAKMTKAVVPPVAFLAYLAGFGAAASGRSDFLVAVVPAAMAGTAVVLVAFDRPSGFMHRVGGTGVAAAVGVALAHLAALLTLPASAGSAGGAGLLLWLVIVAQAGDVAQFLAGRAWGRRSLAPAISPNKTVLGFVGGMVTAIGLGWGLGLLLTGHAWWWGGVLGAAVAVAGTLGDLLISAIKRDCGVKDAGSLIPGHGGVLDRVDSLILAAPLVFWVVV